ncbi:MAG: patatin-like phospholipase family protein [Paucibacter sp.]|nr:patatin-like phospholipase family protein [Roseateles sp.]
MRVVLVLQGGGAMGAYQAGVFEAMYEHQLAPDWIVGTSIGAINAAIVAGNPRETRLARLRAFWERISHRDSVDLNALSDAQRRASVQLQTWDTLLRGVPGFFSPRAFNPFAAGLPVPPEQASFYDTGELASTLNELVDFEYLNAPGGIRLTVNALQVTTGTLRRFDNRELNLHADHIRASGALPPGFPPVRIDGELYWDGGLYSNTPLETVLDDSDNVDTLCFMVDLWNAQGDEPATLEEVQTRQKDVSYASRSQRHIEDYLASHKMRAKLRELYTALPPEARNEAQAKELEALGRGATLHIVRLSYAGVDWHMASKDINFSRGSTAWRWDQGYQDAQRAIEAAGWLALVTDGAPLVVHELPPRRKQGGKAA